MFKNLIALSLLLLAEFCFGGDGEAEAEILIQCHCVNDCNRSSKCEWIWNGYKVLRNIQGSNQNDLTRALANQHVAHFEAVDLGGYGCFTSFGENQGRFSRIDVELDFSDKSVVKSSIVDIIKLPSYEEREAVSSDDLCLFTLDM